ncbi:MAG: dihydrofolate reductase [Saprospiraceae bacterium]|jgi:dihydrofolate reductase
MKKIILYAAISLDGKIAKEDGAVEWLEDIPNPENLDYGYTDFYESIDTTLMGNKTYQQVLGFDVPFPYPGKENYVFTKNKNLKDDENVKFVSDGVVPFLRDLKQKEGKDIWLVGGAEINTLLLNNNLIDELMVFVMPVILGPGISLFSGRPDFSRLTLVESKNYATGIVSMTYAISNQ